jgi:hypothetical protein
VDALAEAACLCAHTYQRREVGRRRHLRTLSLPAGSVWQPLQRVAHDDHQLAQGVQIDLGRDEARPRRQQLGRGVLLRQTADGRARYLRLAILSAWAAVVGSTAKVKQAQVTAHVER